jgi:hypothetical protein
MKAEGAPVLAQWLAEMDGPTPRKVLEMLADDFRISVVFSTGANSAATDFSGDRSALEGYLDQREEGVRRHHIRLATAGDRCETALGEVTRYGEFEATFVAAVQLDEMGRVRRFFTGRSPAVEFPH